MNDDLRDLLDSLVDNAIEEYFLESKFIQAVGPMTNEQRREVARYMHDRLVMSEVEPFVNASFERVEHYIRLRAKFHQIQTKTDDLEDEVNALLSELEDDGIIAQTNHLN